MKRNFLYSYFEPGETSWPRVTVETYNVTLHQPCKHELLLLSSIFPTLHNITIKTASQSAFMYARRFIQKHTRENPWAEHHSPGNKKVPKHWVENSQSECAFDAPRCAQGSPCARRVKVLFRCSEQSNGPYGDETSRTKWLLKTKAHRFI